MTRLGFPARLPSSRPEDGYFSGSVETRRREFLEALAGPDIGALVALRGGYGSNYLLDGLDTSALSAPKCLIGYSDLTSLQIFLWQRLGWVSFYGPMVAAGFHAGAGKPGGYDEASFRQAIEETRSGWSLGLQGETLQRGEAAGRLLGGCLTLLEAAIGTPWQLDTRDSILVLEDRAMKPFQVDRVLMHLAHSSLFAGIRGIILGDFPECEPPVAGSWTVMDVCRRILAPLRIPVVWGAPIGHTSRPMLTLPLGVSARLHAQGSGSLEILEPAVVA